MVYYCGILWSHFPPRLRWNSTKLWLHWLISLFNKPCSSQKTTVEGLKETDLVVTIWFYDWQLFNFGLILLFYIRNMFCLKYYCQADICAINFVKIQCFSSSYIINRNFWSSSSEPSMFLDIFGSLINWFLIYAKNYCGWLHGLLL